MSEDLRIDTGLVLESGGKLDAIAGAIPEPPAAFSPTGADALSTAIAGKVAEVVDPVLAQMPQAKEALTRYAQNVIQAAHAYDSADRQLAEEILKRVEAFDKSVGAPGAGSGPADAAQQAGQLGQMMQMPMQLAQQAAQIPMQVAGMAAAIPQAMMQGVQSAVQQAGQVSQMADAEDLDVADESKSDGAAEKEPDEPAREERRQAAPGDAAGERAPESQQPRPESPAAPKPAPTRPAGSAAEIAL